MRSGRPVRSPGAHPRRRYRRMSIEQMYYFSYAVPMESLRSTPYAAWANTPGRGFIEQIEAGTVLRDPIDVGHLVDRFDAHFAQAHDITADLLAALEAWLQLVAPWDIYLRTMLALESLAPTRHTYK